METKEYKRVMTIAGSDSGGGAGIQADIKTISAIGCFATSAITAITSQNTKGVSEIHIIPTQNIESQITAILEDIGTDAVKLGMLPTKDSVIAIAQLLKKFNVQNIVIDPVMVATSGDQLISGEAAEAIRIHLFPLATLLTPNIPEAEYITGLKINSEADFENVAKAIRSMGVSAVLLKSGHFDAPTLTDHLFGIEQKRYTFDRINTKNTHGTGCTLSSAIAAYLALGMSMAQAIQAAEEYLHNAIMVGQQYKLGEGHGPVHHFYKFWE